MKYPLLTALAAIAMSFAVSSTQAQTQAPKTVRYAYNYVSAIQGIMKEKGFLEKALAPYNAKAEFIVALGSNKGFEYIRGGSADFTSTGGSAALVARANGNPVKVVYYLSHGNLMALVTRNDSTIKSPADLKGKKVAATPGTEPHFFLLRGLESVGLSEKDIKLVPLLHPEGRLALERGDVDAWAGLDPEMAKAELQSKARIFYSNPGILSGSVLVASDAFLKNNPELIKPVLEAHEEARKWLLANPEEGQQIVAKGAGLKPEEAKLAFSRQDFTRPAVTAQDAAKIGAFGALVKKNGDVRASVDLDKVLVELVAPQYFNELGASK